VVDEAGAGVTAPAEDGAALAHAIRVLYAEPEAARAAMGACGRRYYEEHFSHEKLVDELIVRLDQCVRQYLGHEA